MSRVMAAHTMRWLSRLQRTTHTLVATLRYLTAEGQPPPPSSMCHPPHRPLSDVIMLGQARTDHTQGHCKGGDAPGFQGLRLSAEGVRLPQKPIERILEARRWAFYHLHLRFRCG